MPHRRKYGDAVAAGRRHGRDTSLTTARADLACHAARLAMPKALIAKLIGVAPSTLFDWLRRGRDENDSQYNQFYDKFTQAEGEGALGYLSVVHRSSEGGIVTSRHTVTKPNGQVEVSERTTPPNAQAAQWVLERRFARDFGPNRLEVQLLEAQVKSLSERLDRLGALENPQPETTHDKPAPPAGAGATPDRAQPAGNDPPAGGAGGQPDGGAGVPFEL